MESMDIDDEYKVIDEDHDDNNEYKASKSNYYKKKKQTNNKNSRSLGGKNIKTIKGIEKGAITNKFNEYFEAFKLKDEFMINENDNIIKYDFDIESYNAICDEIEDSNDKTKTKKSFSLLNAFYNSQLKHEMSETINKMSQYNLFDLIVELLTNNSNIFLYGFGSKLKLMYNFIEYFQENINGKREYYSYHILVFNCFNPENNLKEILNEIQRYVINLFETLYDFKGINEGLRKHRSIEEQIQTINTLILQLELKGFNDKFLVILNNIEGPNFMNKITQGYLSNIANIMAVNLIATCDNINLVYLWNQTIKDNFAFYFFKFHTFSPYDVEISDMNSLSGEKSLKSGCGLLEIIKSFSKGQKAIIKTLAELQLNEEYDKMTMKGLVDYIIDSGRGICTNQNKLEELLLEPKSHGIVILKQLKKNNKDVLKLNLDKEIIQKIINGEYDD